jgi:hypothetical protein
MTLVSIKYSQFDVRPEIALATKVDPFERGRGKQSLETRSFTGAEPFSQQGARLKSSAWVSECLDDASDEWSVLLADMDLQADDAMLREATPVLR